MRSAPAARRPFVAAVCPPSLLLLAQYASRSDPAAAVRRACLGAVERLGRDRPGQICVVTTPGDERAPLRRPAGIRVADELLTTAGFTGAVREVVVPAQATPQHAQTLGRELSGEALLIMADGSFLRDHKVPEPVARRSRAYDEQWWAALRAGDVEALRGLDPDVAQRLGVTGRAPLHVLAGAVADRSVDAESLYEEAPFGVAYAVAVWRCA